MTNEIDARDVAIGSRIRARREEIRMTQAQLAAAAGVTFQQIQKYEKGVNRVACARLVDIADALKVHPAYFFGASEDEADPIVAMVRTHGGPELASSFLALPVDRQQTAILVVRGLASLGDGLAQAA